MNRAEDSRIEKIRKAIHKEVDRVCDMRELTSVTITFDVGVDRILSAEITTKQYMRTEENEYIYLEEGADHERMD